MILVSPMEKKLTALHTEAMTSIPFELNPYLNCLCSSRCFDNLYSIHKSCSHHVERLKPHCFHCLKGDFLLFNHITIIVYTTHNIHLPEIPETQKDFTESMCTSHLGQCASFKGGCLLSCSSYFTCFQSCFQDHREIFCFHFMPNTVLSLIAKGMLFLSLHTQERH